MRKTLKRINARILQNCNARVHLKAWSADTLSCHTVAVCTILALTHLLTLLAIEPWCTRLIAVDT